MSRRVIGFVGCLALGLLIAGFFSDVAGKPSSLHVPLIYKKTSQWEGGSIDLTKMASVAILVEKFSDKRTKAGSQIGENTEDEGKPPIPIVTEGDIGDFCAEAFRRELTGVGFKVVLDKPTHIIKGEIREFFVTESNSYKGSVAIKLTLTNAAGKDLFTTVALGGSSRFGRSLKAENYQEAFSDALFEAIEKLCGQPGFIDALKS